MEYTSLTDPKAADECGETLKAVCKQLGIPPVLSYGACVDIGKMTHTAKELAKSSTNKLPLVDKTVEIYVDHKRYGDTPLLTRVSIFGVCPHIFLIKLPAFL